MSIIISEHASLLRILISLICIILPLLIRALPPRQPRPKGCRLLGLAPGQKSNLHDEFNPVSSYGTSYRIKALFTYPLKSCRGIELQVADVVPTGLQFDRMFTFAEYGADGWNCRTLRNSGFHNLALIHPEIWVPDPSASDYDPAFPEVLSRGVMVVSYPHLCPAGWRGLLTQTGMMLGIVSRRHFFQVPLSPNVEEKLVPVTIWKDQPLSYDCGQYLPASLHAFLGKDIKGQNQKQINLFRASAEHHRKIYRNAPRKENLGFQPTTSFADAYPIHLLSLSSHRDVASRCAYAIPRLTICRFRANVIIEGPDAFAEDHWKRISIDGTEIHTVCRTVRCLLPNVDYDTGVRHPHEPDRTLKTYRRIDLGAKQYACLGMQLVPAKREFTVRVGDSVDVLEMGEHYYIKMLSPGEKVPGV